MPSDQAALDQRMRITLLTWPIFIELLLRTAINTSDVFMLGKYSDKAVSAVGVITHINFFLMIISMMVSTGAGILIAQYNGAGQRQKSDEVGAASLLLGLIVGSALSLGVYGFGQQFIALYGLENQVAQFGYDYLTISGSFTVNITIGIILTAILRSHGFTRSPMLINLGCGLLNIFGNYCALYQPWGLPIYGVTGVAVSTVVSQLISTALLFCCLKLHHIRIPLRRVFTIDWAIYKAIIRIGGLNAGEMLSYNLAQLSITFFVVKMGTLSLTAYTYAQNLARLAFTFAMALGLAGQIQTSYSIGRGWIEQITKNIQRYFLVGLAISVFITLMTFTFKDRLIPLFTEDPALIPMISTLIAGSILMESGRVFNLIFTAALKGAGDIRFPVILGVCSMWGIGVVCSYLLGISLGWGVLGAWLAVSMDEWVRGLIVARRWRSQRWLKSSV